MNVLPQQLIDKKIKDCYESDKGTLTMEFTDGTKIKLKFDGYFNAYGTKTGSLTPEPLLSIDQ